MRVLHPWFTGPLFSVVAAMAPPPAGAHVPPDCKESQEAADLALLVASSTMGLLSYRADVYRRCLKEAELAEELGACTVERAWLFGAVSEGTEALGRNTAAHYALKSCIRR